MKKKTLWIIILIVVVAIILLLVVGKKSGSSNAVKVAVEKPVKRTIVEEIPANGKIRPVTEVKISPDVSGEIVELYIEEGNMVTKGDLLLKIKPEVYISIRDRAEASLKSTAARLAQSEAQFKQAELAYKRNKSLYEQKVISDSDYEASVSQYEVAKTELDAARYNVQSSEASLKEAEENLSKTVIYAPMSGIVSLLSVEKGERVLGTTQMAGTEVMRIANLDEMEVLVSVNENDIVRVKLNDTATIEVDAYPSKQFKGLVTRIANSATTTGASADQVTNFEVKVLLLANSYTDLKATNSASPFRPGMSASVAIQTTVRNDVMAIPIQAVTTRSDLAASSSDSTNTTTAAADATPKERVFVVQADNTVQAVPITTGIQDNNYIEVLSGLTDSAEVVIQPYTAISKRLKNGSAVQKTDKDKLHGTM